MTRASCVVIAALAACGKEAEHGPPMTGALVPPPLAKLGLVMGASTEADLTERLPKAIVNKDSTMGGSGLVRLNEQAAIYGEDEAAGVAAWLTGSPPRLTQITLHEDGVCDWARAQIAPLHAPMFCGAANRRPAKGAIEACLSTADGAPMSFACELDCAIVGGRHSQCLTLHVSR